MKGGSHINKKKKLIVVSSVLSACMLFLCSAVGCSKAETEKSTAISEVSSVADEVQSSVGTSLLTEQSTQEQPVTIKESIDGFITLANNSEDLKCIVRFGVDNFSEVTYFDGKAAQALYQILMFSEVKQELYTSVGSFDRNKVVTLDFYTGEWESFERITQKPLSEFYGSFGLYSEGYLNCSISIYTSFSRDFQISEKTYDAVMDFVEKHR